jgi:hypothetical protein
MAVLPLPTRASQHPELYGNAVQVTKSDTVDIPVLPQALQVITTGNIVCVLPDDSLITYTAIPCGAVIPYPVKRVNAATTGVVVALY